MKDTLVLFGLRAVIVFDEGCALLFGPDKIFSAEDTNYDLLVIVCVCGVSQPGAQVFGSHFYVRQLFKHLHGALGDATGASDCKDHGGQLFGKAPFADAFTDHFESKLHLVEVLVHVGTADEEGRLELFLKQEFAHAAQEVKRTCNSSVASEGNESVGEPLASGWFSDALKVDEADVALQEGVKERHVVVLRLNGVRKEEVGAAGKQVLHRHFLYAEDH